MMIVSLAVVRDSDDVRLNAFGRPAATRDGSTMRTYTRTVELEAVQQAIEHAVRVYCAHHKIDRDTVTAELVSIRPESVSQRYSREAADRA